MRKLGLTLVAAAAAIAMLASFAPHGGTGPGGGAVDPMAITLAGPALEPTAQPDAF